ncbi:MAG: hypothetical protein IJF27_04355 [Oscillospiraceae bacterium]|nr:hypothetical protein [Oscillospiraceae bacterium]
MKKVKKVLSLISNIHYIKLGFRILLFLAALCAYIVDIMTGHSYLMDLWSDKPIVFHAIWLVFVVEIALRFFPSRLESMGCQKQFKRNYRPRTQEPGSLIVHKKYSAITVAVITVAVAAIVGVLYYTGVIDAQIIFIICLFFSIVDMVCILFFCPFQEWIMKNKCCVTCQIYNWDYPMMFLPLIFVKNFFTWSLLGLSFALVIEWELLKYRYPQRFVEATNCSLSCENCREKLCSHKKSLRRFLAKHRIYKSKMQ